MKGFKVSDVNRTKVIGIACGSLNELINKGKLKLNIPSKDNIDVFLLDGTSVDSEEYFQSLPNQTALLFKRNDENVPSGTDLIYNAFRSVNIEIIRAGETIQQFLDENIKEKICVLAEIINSKRKGDSNTFISNKSEDPDWFLGLETNATTKEAFMFRRSQERIRGYFYKTKSDIKGSCLYTQNPEIRAILDEVFSDFSSSLRRDKYFGCLFDRRAYDALCDLHGSFKCSGVWKSKECLYSGGKTHIINPYSSREERIVFSTWNLDHCIERSRSIIPGLIDAADNVKCNSSKYAVNTSYFYSLLFTKQNLRLVHIVCHDKGRHHTAHCDSTMFTICRSRIQQR